MRKKSNVISKGVLIGLLIGLFICLVHAGIIIWFIFLRYDIPYTKTNFKSYESFQKKEQSALFPDELPSSVKDIQYYYYTGHRDSKSGIAFFLYDEKEYEFLKEMYMSEYQEYYRKMGGEENIKYVFDQPLTDDLVKEMKLEFLYQFFQNSISDYKIVAYEKIEAESMNCIRVIICNDKTKEMIIFSLNDAYSY